MKRRRPIAALGAAAGGSAVFGSGAFTSVQADRDVQVRVADDADALLRLTPVPDSPNRAFTDIENGELAIDISESNTEVLGDGVNANATTLFADLFRVENQGTQTVYLWLLESGGRNGSKRHAFYVGSWRNGGDSARAISLADYNNGVENTRPRELQPQSDAGIDTAAVKLGVGEHIDIGLVVDTPEGSAGTAVLKDGQAVSINATADKDGLADVLKPVYE